MKLLLFLLLPCLALSEVMNDFSQCSQFFVNGVPPQFTPSLKPKANRKGTPAVVPPLFKLSLTGVPRRYTVDSTEPICQCLKDNNGQKIYFYATLYNTAWRIPVYSAYLFGSASTRRCDPWYIEPQLDIKDAESCMVPKGKATGVNQALNRDYDHSKYDRGHLYPVQHTNNSLSMLATSTLTNAAPQDRTFNRGAWNQHEAAVITDLVNCKKAYVVTGVVPDTQKKRIPDDKPRVTVSKYYWRATCCQDSNDKFTGKGYYGPDNNGVVQALSIAGLQTKLAIDYGVNIVIFPGVPSFKVPKRSRTK